MGTLLFTAGLAAIVLLGAWALLAASLERSKLAGWIAASKDIDASGAAAKKLPEPHRQIAAELLESVRVRSTLDDALVKAVLRAAEETWLPPFAVQIGLHILLVALALGPASWALVSAANVIDASHLSLGPKHDAARYLLAPAVVDEAFEGLRDGFARSAVLLALLALAWAVTWWVRRPQVREARLVIAMLEVATRIRPGTAAPVGGRLAGLVAPERGLSRPAAATALWVGALTAAWAILYVTADVRADNHRGMRLEVWPKASRQVINVRPDLVPPTTRGGLPFVDDGVPSVTVGPMQVDFQGRLLAQMKDGKLSTPISEPDTALRERLANLTEVKVIAHQDADVQDSLLPTLRWLRQAGKATKFHLLVHRELPSGRAQADMRFEIGASDKGPALALRVEPEDTLVGAARIPADSPDGHARIRTAVRRLESLYAPADRKPVRVEVASGVTVRRLADALGAADDSCPDDIECGLPGLGLRFVLEP